MSNFEFGFVLPALEDPPTGSKPTWPQIRSLAQRAEALGVDTVWVPDELYWKVPDWPGPRGFWECAALTGAVAGVTSQVKVGTWVLSALHRNPGLTAKVAATLDEVSQGRFILGLGAGHAGSQGKAFGYPDDRIVSRYENALEILVPLLRGNEVTVDGEFHSSFELANRPLGPQGTEVPLMLAGHGPRTIGLAVRHGDVWSAYATESSMPDAFQDRIEMVNTACVEHGRDPDALGKSAGVFLETPGSPVRTEDVGLGVPIKGTVEDVVEVFAAFSEMGFTMLEVSPFPDAVQGLEFLGEVIASLRSAT